MSLILPASLTRGEMLKLITMEQNKLKIEPEDDLFDWMISRRQKMFRTCEIFIPCGWICYVIECLEVIYDIIIQVCANMKSHPCYVLTFFSWRYILWPS